MSDEVSRPLFLSALIPEATARASGAPRADGDPNGEGVGNIDPLIRSIVIDSRHAAPHSLFFALPGEYTDGFRYVEQAATRGAVAAVCSSKYRREARQLEEAWRLKARQTEISTRGSRRDEAVFSNEAALSLERARIIALDDPRKALSKASALLYGEPSRSLTVIGVTGTDGKSTSVAFISRLLTALGEKTGYISTAASSYGDKETQNSAHLSTPEAPYLHAALRRMVDRQCRYAAIESTSHALSKRSKRLDDVDFDAALFTNLTHEHLDFHGSFRQYRDDKANLFRSLDTGNMAILNADDSNASYFASQTAAKILYYGLERHDHLHLGAIDIEMRLDRCLFTLLIDSEPSEMRLSAPFGGRFNLSNALGAMALTHAITGRPYSEIARHLHTLRLPVGRLQIISMPPRISWYLIVDYAHTPGAFTQLLPFVRDHTQNRVIALFGSAGERDLDKRAMLGAIAARYADVIILCDEDPRSEESRHILLPIAQAARQIDARFKRDDHLAIIPDRHKAIRKAIGEASDGDTVLLLGKGHEKTIDYGDRSKPWDEVAVAQELVEEHISNRHSIEYDRPVENR